jgi:hypothetical protein
VGKNKKNKKSARKSRASNKSVWVKTVTGSVALVAAVTVGVGQAEAILAAHAPASCMAGKNV